MKTWRTVDRHQTQKIDGSIDLQPAKLSNFHQENDHNSQGCFEAKLPYGLPAQKQIALDAQKATNVTLYGNEDQNKYFNMINNSQLGRSERSLRMEPGSVSENREPIKIQQPLMIDINQRPSQKAQLQNGNETITSFPSAHAHPITIGSAIINMKSCSSEVAREPFYSQKKGVDVTRLIKQRKDELAQERIECSRQQKNNQLASDGMLQVPGDPKDITLGFQDLSHALSITQKKATLSSIEEGKLVSGIEQIVRTLLFPEMAGENGHSHSPEDSILHSKESGNMVSLEPLEIGFEPTLIFPKTTKQGGSYPPHQVRRNLLLPGRNDFLIQNPNSRPFWQHTQRSNMQQTMRQDSSLSANEQRLVKEQTMILLRNLSDEEKQKFILILNEVHVQKDQRDEVVQLLEKKMLGLRTKLQRQELSQIREEMISSNKKLQEINARFGSPHSVRSQSDAGQSYIGCVPLQEPPYTLNYLRERRDRIERRKHGMLNCKIKQKRPKSDDSQTSLPDLSHNGLQPPPPETRHTKRIHSQQTHGADRRRFNKVRKQQTSRGEEEVLSEVNGFSSHKESCVSPKSTIMQKYNQRLRKTCDSKQRGEGIFSVPQQHINKFRVGNSLLFRQKKTKKEPNSRQSGQSQQSQQRQQMVTIQAKIPTNSIFTEDSVFTVPEALNHTMRASMNSAAARESCSVQQADRDSILEIDLLQRSQGDQITQDQYSKYMSLTTGKDPVRVQESFEQAPSSRINHSRMTKNQQHVLSGRLQNLRDYSHELISSQVDFDNQVEDCDLQHDAFMSLVQTREQKLERVFTKSFKMGSMAATMPPAILDLFTALVDGYKSSMAAFGKFTLRQKQQTDYKIERLSRVNQDLRQEMNKQRVYDEFLRRKLDNLKEEMTLIEEKIDKFNDSTLLGVSREMIKDSFSEVTAHLDAIANDLGQERVPVAGSAIVEEENENTQASGEGDGESKRARVSTFDVLPFKTIKRQIDSNYCEIQSKTTKAIINRLGLGGVKPVLYDTAVQTEEAVCSEQELKETQMKLYDASELVIKLELEMKKLSNQLSSLNKDLEKRKASLVRSKHQLKETMSELTKAQMKSGELQTEKECLNEELTARRKQVQTLENELKQKTELVKEQEKIVLVAKEEAKKAEDRIETIKQEYIEYKEEIVQVQEKLQDFETKTVEKEQKIEEQAVELVQVYQKNDKIMRDYDSVAKNLKNLKQELKDNKNELKKMFEHYQGGTSATTLRGAYQKNSVRDFSESKFEMTKKPSTKLSGMALEISEPISNNVPTEQDAVPGRNLPEQQLSDQTLNIEGPLNEQDPAKEDDVVVEPRIEVKSRLTNVDLPAPEPEIKCDDSEKPMTPVKKFPQQKPAEEPSVYESQRLPTMEDQNPLSDVESDSAVSSAEHDDRVGEGLDVIGMRKVLRRQSTICPTKSNFRSSVAQTDLSGPVIQDPSQVQVEQETKRQSQTWQPIYAFSYNREVPLGGPAQGSELKRTETKKKQRLAAQGTFGRSQLGDDDTCMIKVDKSIVQKGGKIIKGTVFRNQSNKKNEEMKMKNSMPFMIGSVHQSIAANPGAIGDGLESRAGASRLSQANTGRGAAFGATNRKQVIKKHSSFFAEEPMFRTLDPHHSQLSNPTDRLSTSKIKTKKVEMMMTTPKSMRRATNMNLPVSQLRSGTEHKSTNIHAVSSFQKHVTSSKEPPGDN